MIPAFVGAQDFCVPARRDLSRQALSTVAATFA